MRSESAGLHSPTDCPSRMAGQAASLSSGLRSASSRRCSSAGPLPPLSRRRWLECLFLPSDFFFFFSPFSFRFGSAQSRQIKSINLNDRPSLLQKN